jgi:hypothetical protein
MRMYATIWHSDSEKEAWIKEIATKHAVALEASLNDYVFYDERTNEEYKYEPDEENHQQLISLFTSFVERSIMSFGKDSGDTEPDAMV